MSGSLKRPSIFDGFLSIDDPNIKFVANANVDLHKGEEKIKLNGHQYTSELLSKLRGYHEYLI